MNYRKWIHTAARGRILAGVAGFAATLSLVGCGNDKPAPIPTPTPTPVTPAPTPPAVAFCDPANPAPTPAPAPGSAITYQTGDGHRIRIHNGVLTIQAPVTQTTTEDFRYASHGTCEVLGGRVLRTWAGDRRSITLPGGAKLTMRGQSQQLLRVSIYDGATSREVDVLTHTVMHDSSDAAIARSRDAAEYDGETAQLDTLQFPATRLDPLSRTYMMQLINFYTEAAAADGTPAPRISTPQLLGRQDKDVVRAAIAVPAAPAQTDAVCSTTPDPQDGLTRNADGTLTYLTRSGQWRVKLDGHTITVSYTGSDGMAAEMWGDPHENLNGKHIKDWETSRRSVVLGDGTKITMHADGPQEVIHTTSIYDGAQSHEIGSVGNVVRHSCINTATARERDAQEADGETALLTMLRSPQSQIGGLSFLNVYTETKTATGQMERDISITLLGDTGEGDINPKQVNDYYDDPRIGHT
ncbi:hypothetical protein GRI97_09775 [Altererythrobacter xixiisoli]|uniref:Lipoprotein n=2 Tax=Croceibacterium xixiisoli TaxID=1476466 RepID=A0A6I4TWU7_9SPHN|nr:hypothetical protein [Croceibacterium xixiisoli]